MSATASVITSNFDGIVKVYKEGDVTTPVVTTYTNTLFTLADDNAQYSYTVEDVDGVIQATGECVRGNNYAQIGIYTMPASSVSAQVESQKGISPLVVDLLQTPVKVGENVTQGRSVHIYGDLYGNSTATIMTLGAGYRPIDPISITALRIDFTTSSWGITSSSYTSLNGSLLANGLMQLEDAIKGLEADVVNRLDVEYDLQ